MFWTCANFLGSMVRTIMNLNIPGTTVSFLDLCVAMLFLPILFRVFARIFSGNTGGGKLKEDMKEDKDE